MSNMTKRPGYFLISRSLLKHPRFAPRNRPFTDLEAWLWMIEAAAFKEHSFRAINGRAHETIKVQPGQFSHSIRFLARAWKWGDKRVQRFLAALESDGSVTTQTTTQMTTQSDIGTTTSVTTGQTVVTLCNWEKYQRPFDVATTGTTTSVTTDMTTQTTTQMTTKKKEGINNLNKDFDDDAVDARARAREPSLAEELRKRNINIDQFRASTGKW